MHVRADFQLSIRCIGMRVWQAIATIVLILCAVVAALTGLFLFAVVALPGMAIIAVTMGVTRSVRKRIQIWRWIAIIVLWLAVIPVVGHQTAGVPPGSQLVAVGQHVPASTVTFAGGGEAQPGPYLGDIDFDRQWWMPIDSKGNGQVIAQPSDYVILARPDRAELHLSKALIGYGPRAWWDPEQPRALAFGGLALLAGLAVTYFVTAPVAAALGVIMEVWFSRRSHVPDSARAGRRGGSLRVGESSFASLDDWASSPWRTLIEQIDSSARPVAFR